MTATSKAVKIVTRSGRTIGQGVAIWPPRGANKGSKANVEWAEFIGRVATHGDRDAFKALFEHFAPRIKGFLLKKGCSAEEAEEIAQNTLLAVWRKADQFDPNSSAPAAWIFTIARNLRIDSVRRAARDNRVFQGAELEYSVDPIGAAESISSGVDASRVTAAIDMLSSDQSAVIRMSFMEERPHSEIAATLGIPLGTVKSRIRLAMKRLKDLLDKER
jgi:RNA polymerase sigma-70 factor (ECF subfamily)